MEPRSHRLTTSTLLGIRFWDPVTDTQVTDALDVTARRDEPGGLVARAFATAAGVYAFQGLCGMGPAERAPIDERGSATHGTFIIDVVDRRRRFVPVTFAVELPAEHLGVFQPAGPDVGTAHGFFLFSAPTRSSYPGRAVLRADLVHADTGAAAAHAVVVVTDGVETWFGIADERGRMALMFPYPAFVVPPSAPPPGSPPGSPPASQPGSPPASPPGSPPASPHWSLNVRVCWEPSALAVPIGGSLPDLGSIVRQGAAAIVSGDAGPGTELECTLIYGRELVLRSGTASTLRLRPAGS